MFPHPEMKELEDALRQSRPVTQPLPPGVKQRLRAQLLEKTDMKTSIFLLNRLASAVVGLILTIVLPALFMFGSVPSFGTTPPAGGPVFGGLFQLLSHNYPTPVSVNQSFEVQLVWMALRPPNQDYNLFLQLLDEKQQVVAHSDQFIDTANWPPQQPQEVIVRLMAPAEPGRYLLVVGWSDPQLTLDTQQTTWLLGELEVVLDESTVTPLPTRPTEEPPPPPATETPAPYPSRTPPPTNGTVTPRPTHIPPTEWPATPLPTRTPPGQFTSTPPAWPTATPGNPTENTPTPPPNWPTATPGNPGQNTPTPPAWPTPTIVPTRTPPGQFTPTPPAWPTSTIVPTRTPPGQFTPTPPPNWPTATPGNPGENTPTPPPNWTPTPVPSRTPPPGQFTPTPPPNWPTATPGNPGQNTPTPTVVPTQTMPPGQFTPTPTPPNNPPNGATPTRQP